MEITIRARGFDLYEDTRDMVLRRTQFALDAFEKHVESVSIFLLDLNGPKGGVDKLCQVNVKVAGLTQIATIENGNTVETAVNEALKTAKYRVSEAIRKKQETDSMRAAVA